MCVWDESSGLANDRIDEERVVTLVSSAVSNEWKMGPLEVQP